MGNKYAIFNGDLNQTQLSHNQSHNGHVGWPICAPLWLAIHAQNIILKPTLIPSNFRFGILCFVLPDWDRSKGYLINQMDLNNSELDQSQDPWNLHHLLLCQVFDIEYQDKSKDFLLLKSLDVRENVLLNYPSRRVI